jgi:HD-GYP domain-containing protein (c-di-GMP phosphodiesterase class II)
MATSANPSRIVLSGVSPHIAGLHWEATQKLTIGRDQALDIVLEEATMGRNHAEVLVTPRGWVLRDCNSRNGTFLNGLPVHGEPKKLQLHDVLHCGQTAFRVTVLEQSTQPAVPLALPEKLDIKTTRSVATLKSATQRSWEQALQALTQDPAGLARGKRFFALIRAGYHLCRVESLNELLQSILNDTVTVFGAAQGAVVLHVDGDSKFTLNAYAPQPCPPGIKPYSLTLTQHCFTKGESFLCADSLKSQWGGGPSESARASVICALLRSPRKRLGVLHLGRRADQPPFNNEDLQLADALAASVSAGIECAQIVAKNRQPMLGTAATFAHRTMQLRDPHTGRHAERVQTYAGWLGEEIGLTPEDLERLKIGALLHDMGKIGIADELLTKCSPLSEADIATIREQPANGTALAQSLPDLEPVIPIIRSHRERWDGTGYPDGLAGEDIPPLARIVAIVDAFDAMTTEQPYRPARSLDEALAELQAGAGTQFDPKLVEVFLRLRPRLEQVGSPALSMTDSMR